MVSLFVSSFEDLLLTLCETEALLEVSSKGGPMVRVTEKPESLIRFTMSPWCSAVMSKWFTARMWSPT